MFSIILSCVTEVPGTSFKVQGGSVIAAFFLAHNYVSEQFSNYVDIRYFQGSSDSSYPYQR